MANQEHLDILNQGVDVWNKWRDGHQDIRPDLSFAYYFRADHDEANFDGDGLSDANFSGANLSNALQLHLLTHQY